MIRILGRSKTSPPAPGDFSGPAQAHLKTRDEKEKPEQMAREQAQLSQQLKVLEERERALEHVIQQYRRQKERDAWELEHEAETENMLEDCREALEQLKEKANGFKKGNVLRGYCQEYYPDFGRRNP